MKTAVLALARTFVRLFYRRIEVSGLERVPPAGPALLVANHPNGLVDPMVVLASLPRPVVFVAKSTLWKIPVLRSVLDLLGCVPVVRRGEEDPEISSNGPQGEGPDRNEEAFRRLASVLRAGGCVLIFPEGRSHSDPRLSEMRTGAARVLLLSDENPPVVLPVGLWFTKKEEFRSEVLLQAGPPVAPPAEATVEAWTDAIGAALESVTLNADSWRDHETAAAVDALYGRSVENRFLEGEEKTTSGGAGPLERSMRVRQLLIAARGSLDRTNPGEVGSLVRHTLALDHLLRRSSLSFSSLDDPPSAATIAWHTLKAIAVIAIGFPVAVLGVAAWWVPYRLTGVIANRLPGAHERDQIALYKLLVGCVLFPIALSLWTAAAWRATGPAAAALAFLLLPFAGIASLLFLEYASWREGQARELLALALAPGAIVRLRARRDALVAECDRLAEVAARLSSTR